MSEPFDFGEVPSEKSDLRRLKYEVLDRGPDAALPKNLPDDWLSLLARDLEMLQMEHKEYHVYLSAPIAITSAILFAKRGKNTNELSFSQEELLKNLSFLHLEISLEIVRRHTGVGPAPATLETIFSNRELS